MSNKKSLKNRIIEYIEEKGSITSREAIYHIGLTSFGARLTELRHDGYVFYPVKIKGVNRYGDTTYYYRYFLDEKARNDYLKLLGDVITEKFE